MLTSEQESTLELVRSLLNRDGLEEYAARLNAPDAEEGEPVTREQILDVWDKYRWYPVGWIEDFARDVLALATPQFAQAVDEPVAEWVQNEHFHTPQLEWAPGYVAKIGDKLYVVPQPTKGA